MLKLQRAIGDMRFVVILFIYFFVAEHIDDGIDAGAGFSKKQWNSRLGG